MADGVATLEARIKRLEQLLQAHEAPQHVVKIDYTGERGAVEEQFDKVAQEHGFQDHHEMGDVAGTQFTGASLPWLGGRRIGITTKAQADAFMAGTWTPYRGEEPPETTNHESVDPKSPPGGGSHAGEGFAAVTDTEEGV